LCILFQIAKKEPQQKSQESVIEWNPDSTAWMQVETISITDTMNGIATQIKKEYIQNVWEVQYEKDLPLVLDDTLRAMIFFSEEDILLQWKKH